MNQSARGCRYRQAYRSSNGQGGPMHSTPRITSLQKSPVAKAAIRAENDRLAFQQFTTGVQVLKIDSRLLLP